VKTGLVPRHPPTRTYLKETTGGAHDAHQTRHRSQCAKGRRTTRRMDWWLAGARALQRAFGLAEAKALIEQHRAAVWAIAEALMVERP
jgi:hypothetical protein